MRDLIKKILRENSLTTVSGTREERIKQIDERIRIINRLLPKIKKFIEINFGSEIEKVEIGIKAVHYGNENYSVTIPEVDIYFKENTFYGVNEIKTQIFEVLKNYFNIDVTRYGVPIHFTFYKKVWEKM